MDTKTMTLEQEVAALRAENEALKASKARGISFKVGKAGGVAVYGLGKFPVTLYKSQWDTFLAESNINALKAFIKAHESELKAKPVASVLKDNVQETIPATA